MSRTADEDRAALGGWRVLEFMRFGAVGVSSTILYLAVYAAAVLVGVGFILAALAAFVLSAVYGYLLHDRCTFRTNAPTRGGLARWLVLQGTVLGLNVLALWTLVRQAGIDRLLAQVILLPLLPLVTYLLSRRHVFAAA
ncbi:MAG: GtrA family protein [Chloroflexota bacterium]|nr:GtrA family protein [Chloroflexota bacterium]